MSPSRHGGAAVGGALVVVLVVALGVGGLLVTVQLAGTGITTWTLLPGMVLTGTGLGLVARTLIDVVLAGVDPGDARTASRALNTALQLGASVGIALIGVVYFGSLPDKAALAADPGGGHTTAMASALWCAAAFAATSALAMFLLPGTAPAPPSGRTEQVRARWRRLPPAPARRSPCPGATRCGTRIRCDGVRVSRIPHMLRVRGPARPRTATSRRAGARSGATGVAPA